MKIAIITGASSGMGREFVRQISADYCCLDEIWVIGRNKKRLYALEEVSEVKLRVLPLDLRKKEGQERLKRMLKAENPKIKLLVNSAGIGKTGEFTDHSLNSIRSTLRVNCEALTAVTYLALPYMHRRSRILQMASASAFVPQPEFAVYAASKSYVLSFSRALRREIAPRGITVTCVCPGPVDTPFLERARKGLQVSSLKDHFLAEPGEVVEKAIRDTAAGRELSIYSKEMKALFLACKLVPHQMIMKISGILNEVMRGGNE